MLSSLPPWRRKLNQEPVARGRVAGLLQGGIPVPGPTSTLGCGWDSPSHSGRPELVSLASKPQHRPFRGPRHLLFFFALQILPRSSRLLLPRPLPSPWPPDSTHASPGDSGCLWFTTGPLRAHVCGLPAGKPWCRRGHHPAPCPVLDTVQLLCLT